MRVIVKLKGTDTTIPFDNQSLMNSYIHRCLGKDNPYHDRISDYSISYLIGGKMLPDKSGIDFRKGGCFVISSMNNEFMIKIVKGIMTNRTLFHGIEFDDFDYIQESFYNGWNHFATLSPILIKKTDADGSKHYINYKEPDFIDAIKQNLEFKLNHLYGVKADLEIVIKQSSFNKTKLIKVKNIVNYCNMCHISINCSKQVAEMIYNIGIGVSTGSGFGSIYYSSKHAEYWNLKK